MEPPKEENLFERLTNCRRRAFTRDQNFIPQTVFNFLECVNWIAEVEERKPEVEVHARSGVVGLRNATTNEIMFDAVLLALDTNGRFNIAAKLLALVPRHRGFKRFTASAGIENKILKV